MCSTLCPRDHTWPIKMKHYVILHWIIHFRFLSITLSHKVKTLSVANFFSRSCQIIHLSGCVGLRKPRREMDCGLNWNVSWCKKHSAHLSHSTCSIRGAATAITRFPLTHMSLACSKVLCMFPESPRAEAPHGSPASLSRRGQLSLNVSLFKNACCAQYNDMKNDCWMESKTKINVCREKKNNWNSGVVSESQCSVS